MWLVLPASKSAQQLFVIRKTLCPLSLRLDSSFPCDNDKSRQTGRPTLLGCFSRCYKSARSIPSPFCRAFAGRLPGVRQLDKTALLTGKLQVLFFSPPPPTVCGEASLPPPPLRVRRFSPMSRFLIRQLGQSLWGQPAAKGAVASGTFQHSWGPAAAAPPVLQLLGRGKAGSSVSVAASSSHSFSTDARPSLPVTGNSNNRLLSEKKKHLGSQICRYVVFRANSLSCLLRICFSVEHQDGMFFPFLFTCFWSCLIPPPPSSSIIPHPPRTRPVNDWVMVPYSTTPPCTPAMPALPAMPAMLSPAIMNGASLHPSHHHVCPSFVFPSPHLSIHSSHR